MSWAWIWAFIAAWLFLRKNYYHRQAIQWQSRWQEATEGPAQGSLNLGTADKRETRVNEKLKERCIANEKTITDLNAEIRKRDKIIASYEIRANAKRRADNVENRVRPDVIARR